MAKIEITVPGERIVEDFTALVPQPTSPSTARAPDVGLVELSYVTPTELVPGPPGPPGPAGSRWYTGVGDPTITGAKLGDMYLDDVTGYIWTYNGTAWVMTGTDLSPNASELLTKIKTVDGSGSGLDADTLDGQDGTYYLDYDNLTDKPSSFPPSAHGHPFTDITGTFTDAQHGNRAGGPLHATATAATAGFFVDAPSDSTQYVRQNAAWSPVSVPPGTAMSDSPPGSPLPGAFWWESDTGNLFVFYVDPGGAPGQWVQVNVPATVIGGSGGGGSTVSITVGTTPPSSPAIGDIWIDTN